MCSKDLVAKPVVAQLEQRGVVVEGGVGVALARTRTRPMLR